MSMLLVSLAAAGLADDANREYEVKAAFIYNFAKFAEWPPEPKPSPRLNLCVLGRDPFGPALNLLNGKEVQGRALQVRRLADDETWQGCHIIYFAPSEARRLQKLIETLSSTEGLLSVSDIEGFARSGGMIELLLQDKKVRFAVNRAAAQRARIALSSKLLSLAAQIEGD